MNKILKSLFLVTVVAFVLTTLYGCAHSLEAKYGPGEGAGHTVVNECPKSQLALGVKPPQVKDQYEQALSESIVDALGHAGCFSRIQQNYSANKSGDAQSPELILETTIATAYSDDGAGNWAKQWPGVLAFTTWWKGLLYYLDISTDIRITDTRIGMVINVPSKDRYEIHYSSTARGVFSGSIVGWFVLTGVAFLSALVPTDWDDNMKLDTNIKIRDEYGKIIAKKIIQSLKGKA
ncbi:hypothetical protein [Methylomicrobium lacus]|uniref:hypothetical protein n=1 Tax=Methylomicrobium lacus TaxID=136992 RepID=UPI0035A8FDA4